MTSASKKINNILVIIKKDVLLPHGGFFPFGENTKREPGESPGQSRCCKLKFNYGFVFEFRRNNNFCH